MLRAKYSSRTTLFFERFRVRKNRAKREGIYSVAGLIASSAKQSLRIRRGPSRPGAIPHAHTRGGLRMIQFAVDGNRAIIGPVRFPRSRQYNEPVPSIHEFGKLVYTLSGIMRLKKYPERPYMYPTIKRLARRGKLPRNFSAQVAKVL